MAEWLGEGLQNLLRRFDSVWYLKKMSTNHLFKQVVGVLFVSFYN